MTFLNIESDNLPQGDMVIVFSALTCAFKDQCETSVLIRLQNYIQG